MRRVRSSSTTTFAPLRLSEIEERAIADDAALHIKRTLVQEAEFRRRGGKVNGSEWKQVRVQDGLHIYKQRRVSRAGLMNDGDSEVSSPELLASVHNDDSSRWRHSLFDVLETSTSTGSSGSDSGDSKVPAMLAAGHIEGKLEDAMLGVYDGDDHAWRVRAALLKDKFEQALILATIQHPTYDKPFNFLGVKWFSIEYPPVVGNFIQKRDMLVTEALGIDTDDNGEEYGYAWFHDFRHPSVPELTDQGMIRGKTSLCFIFRQASPTRISLYARGSIDGGGEIPKGLAIVIAATSIISNTETVKTSYSRKLSWLVTSQTRQRHLMHEKHVSSGSCHACERIPMLRGLFGCHACGFKFCSKCYVERKIVLGREDLALHSLSFCFNCVLQAKELSPVDVARATIVPQTKDT
ncbi:hypothetical protein Poli38472_012566 [Pythium oligandrum]|uniref:FYVE-type domain-containing protein n=1 Tax=Pythium oligandrum TaxID=41045 RepID=A0A8K1CDV9_PYTOL|nr:hypothetical protein Poli38472_012566 [Pythium oligandrum]|eukprot:TMW61375.1 hypothetical protein Poli38472_012566 [Pythium oligandrum]